jgi:hypothetical protein
MMVAPMPAVPAAKKSLSAPVSPPSDPIIARPS